MTTSPPSKSVSIDASVAGAMHPRSKLSALPHHKYWISLGAPLIRVAASVAMVFEEFGFHHAAQHQHFVVDSVQIEYSEGLPNLFVVPSKMFVALRFGDGMGLDAPVPLKIGDHVLIQGEYLNVGGVYKMADNHALPVLHFCHHPVGFVQVDGVKYQ